MQEALDCLTYGVQSRKGFILLTGEVGTGKTTLINKLLELLHEQDVPTAFVFNSRLDVPTFLSYMMQDFGIPCDAKSKSRVLILFYNWLLDRYRAGETAVLIVDEAQNLSDGTPGGNPHDDECGILHGETAADCAGRTAGTGTET